MNERERLERLYDEVKHDASDDKDWVLRRLEDLEEVNRRTELESLLEEASYDASDDKDWLRQQLEDLE